MQNKVLVEIIIPDIEKRYEIFLPINKKIGNIIILLNRGIKELNSDHEQKNFLYNRDTGKKYEVDTLLYNTDIRNGTALIFI